MAEVARRSMVRGLREGDTVTLHTPMEVGQRVHNTVYGTGVLGRPHKGRDGQPNGFYDVLLSDGNTQVIRGDMLRPITSDHDPVDLWAKFDPPELPQGILPKVIEDFAFSHGETMGADPGGLAAAALAVCAAAIPDRIKLQVKVHDDRWRESARLWIGLIGEPSTKKSPLMSAAIAPLARLDTALFREYKRALSEYGKLGKEDQKAATPPKQRRLRIEDATIEATQGVLADSPDGVLLAQDELSGWFGSMDKYSGGRGAAKDRGFWLQSFNGGAYAVNRVGRGADLIENLSVSLLGGIQPEPIRKIAHESHDDGLLQRLFPIVLRPATLGRDEPKSDEVAEYEATIDRLTRLHEPAIVGGNLSGLPAVLVFDEGAQAIRRDLEQKHLDLVSCEAINKKLGAHIGKYDGLFARLAIVFHCVDNAGCERPPRVINENTARRAADFLHGFLMRHAVAFYAGTLDFSEAHDAVTATAGYILAHDEMTEITPRNIQRGDRTMRSLDRDAALKVLDQLEAFGWLDRLPIERNQTTPRFAVNRRVHELYAKRGEAERERRQQARAMIAAIAGSKA